MRRPIGLPVLLVLGGVAWAGLHALAHQAAAVATATHTHPGHHGAEPAYLATSLTLCLALALALAAANGLQARRHAVSARSFWLFGAVPVLGLFAGAFIDAGGSLAGGVSGVGELLPVAALVLVVQVSVAFTAVRAARGVLDLVAGAVRALAGPALTGAPRAALSFFAVDVAGIPATAPARAGSSRAPPASFPAL